MDAFGIFNGQNSTAVAEMPGPNPWLGKAKDQRPNITAARDSMCTSFAWFVFKG